MKSNNRLIQFYPRGTTLGPFAAHAFLWLTIVISGGCRKLISVGSPEMQINNTKVFASDASATAAVMGIYIDLSVRETGIIAGGLSLCGGWASDELQIHSTTPDYQEFYTNNLRASNNVLLQWWTEIYKNIYAANLVLEELPLSPGLSGQVKRQLEGEARFIRAFLHFYAINLFGPAPYITSTAYRENARSKRLSEDSVYRHIIDDLIIAEKLLPDMIAGGARTRPSALAASSLLSRVYLYLRQWERAEAAASKAIDHPAGLIKLEDSLDTVFLSVSAEAIWQLQPVRPLRNTNEAFYFTKDNTLRLASLSDQFYQAGFEQGDKRKQLWVNKVEIGGASYYSPYKYKIGKSEALGEYQSVLRLAELLLIRAEARAQLNKLIPATHDLNRVRNRAGLSDFNPGSGDHLLEAIARERKAELFAEAGHRWFDLKRTGQAGPVLAAIKSAWEPTDRLFPIPQKQLDNNPGFTQNAGY
ncbi:MAG TPA: RagB/SusD family nutrient uptake outer membrane protein [Flavitalea sp.]|nr:RagB/SusD family nutrient uptake outer membrane protein [Flavitalea sp.]